MLSHISAQIILIATAGLHVFVFLCTVSKHSTFELTPSANAIITNPYFAKFFRFRFQVWFSLEILALK